MRSRAYLSLLALLAVALLSACGSSSGSGSSSSTQPHATAASKPALAAYAKTLQSRVGDVRGLDQCITGYNRIECLRWAQTDLRLKSRELSHLSHTKVSSQLRSDNAQVMTMLKKLVGDDQVLIAGIKKSGLRAQPNAEAKAAAMRIESLTNGRLLPLLRRLDPNIGQVAAP